ncbi:DUF4396 domain-containing protein [Arthrobacter sp. H5]|uniref:DUF4396 domain-containing protein n=1 Tax=Arthrobacter sp. H5 TaxID=1267973 RepID=UPI00056952B0|nr:DUF4396 domain-containing protein [Arthrobacter sp. H5]
METALPGWLTPVSWIFVALGVISAALVLYDIYGRRNQQPNAAMGIVWPISALYLGPFGLWAYNRWGKTGSSTPGGRAARSEKDFHGKTLTGSTPGGAAATVGHFIGVPLVVASGLTIAGTNLWVLIIVIALLAIALLFVFEYFFASSEGRGSAGKSAGVALLTASVTVLAFDIGMGGWMLVMHFGNFMPAPTDISFFFLMQIGLVLGFLTAYPAVRALIRRRVAVAA